MSSLQQGGTSHNKAREGVPHGGQRQQNQPGRHLGRARAETKTHSLVDCAPSRVLDQDALKGGAENIRRGHDSLQSNGQRQQHLALKPHASSGVGRLALGFRGGRAGVESSCIQPARGPTNVTNEPSSSSEATELLVPSWVPTAVAAQAQGLYAGLGVYPPDVTGQFAAAVKRLATDSRMQRVWSELDKRRGGRAKSVEFVHPTRSTAVSEHGNTESANLVLQGLAEDERLRQQAMVNVFSNAVSFFSWDRAGPGPRTRTMKSVDAEVRDLNALARRLRDDSAQLTRLGGSRFALQVEEAAVHCDLQADLARAATQNDPLIAERQSSRLGDPWVQGFIIETAAHFNALFGKRMLGLVALMANVAFEREDLIEDRIRGVFRGKPQG
jgi:hypothetical protein